MYGVFSRHIICYFYSCNEYTSSFNVVRVVFLAVFTEQLFMAILVMVVVGMDMGGKGGHVVSCECCGVVS